MELNNTISVIIPFFNEERSLPSLVTLINDFHRNREFNLEVIFVDDGSNDNSIKNILESSPEFKSKIIKLSQNYGSHSAVRAGLMHASGDYGIFYPADMQDPVEMIQLMYDEIKKGYDIVAAQRKNIKVNFITKTFSRIYSFLIQKFAVSRYPDKGVDLILINKKIIDQLNNNIEANSSIFLQILNLGFSLKFISYEKSDRKFGKSKWTLSKKFKLLIDSFTVFSYVPIRLVTIFGSLFFITGILWTVFITARKLIYNDLMSGWTMLTSILFLGFGITNISLGIIAEYLWRTLDASRKTPVFTIDEIITLNKN